MPLPCCVLYLTCRRTMPLLRNFLRCVSESWARLPYGASGLDLVLLCSPVSGGIRSTGGSNSVMSPTIVPPRRDRERGTFAVYQHLAIGQQLGGTELSGVIGLATVTSPRRNAVMARAGTPFTLSYAGVW